MPDTRDRMLDYIARKVFDGDELAAQYLICATTAKMYVLLLLRFY